eukprot:4834901-Amphidinium_carterae.1
MDTSTRTSLDLLVGNILMNRFHQNQLLMDNIRQCEPLCLDRTMMSVPALSYLELHSLYPSAVCSGLLAGRSLKHCLSNTISSNIPTQVASMWAP